jgi:putative transposase
MKRKREVIGNDRRYTFKLYPSKMQEQLLVEQCQMMAALWNALLQRCEDSYRRTKGQRRVLHGDGKSLPTFFDMTAEITSLRHECLEWAALSVWSAHRVADALSKAFDAFFRRAKTGAGAQSGYPRYRRVRDADWLPHRFKSGCKLVPRADTRSSWRLTIKGISGAMRARGEFPQVPLNWTDADIRFRGGDWWLSVGVEMPKRRSPGDAAIKISFDLIDEFARVERSDGATSVPPEGALATEGKSLSGMDCDGGPHSVPHGPGCDDGKPHAELGETAEMPNRDGGEEAAIVERRADELKSERDRRYRKGSWRWREASRKIARIQAKAARIRREGLHEWSTAIICEAADLTIIAPKVKEETASPRGNGKSWGANVETVSKLNRHVLNQSPAMAVQMLAYKAKEAGIRCDIVEDESPNIAIGAKLVAAGKQLRKTKRALKEKHNEHYQQGIGGA